MQKLSEVGLLKKETQWDVTFPGLVSAIDLGADPQKILNRLKGIRETRRIEGPTGIFGREEKNPAYLFQALCEFAISVGRKSWSTMTSRPFLLMHFADMLIEEQWMNGTDEKATMDFPWDKITPESNLEALSESSRNH